MVKLVTGLHIGGDEVVGNFEKIHVFDIASPRWYAQITTGDIIPNKERVMLMHGMVVQRPVFVQHVKQPTHYLFLMVLTIDNYLSGALVDPAAPVLVMSGS